ncbi:hypothetical protein M407DRAFT_226270 [Tulasnella calospora MUT 4182]|uniref:Uncharacterized protein n=1 Tax=Tulasnella calospora MUT 4182 TaxID=1051891 RepID=A0A0C3Q4E8_9AGAM|nr:hypothetical protein M407DRAFT_226270 [Tulasnella calospora MUT 4182]
MEQLVDAIDIPTSTTCLFIASLQMHWDYYFERLEPINRRLTTLAEASRGTKSTLTFSHANWTGGIPRTTYEGQADEHGAFTAEFLLKRLHKHLPDTDEILIDDPSSKFIEDALSTLFPSNHSSGLFPRLSTLIVRKSVGGVSSWLEKWQKRQDKQGGVQPLPLQTLKIEGRSVELTKAWRMEDPTISAESVKVLEKLVPNLVLNHVAVK